MGKQSWRWNGEVSEQQGRYYHSCNPFYCSRDCERSSLSFHHNGCFSRKCFKTQFWYLHSWKSHMLILWYYPSALSTNPLPTWPQEIDMSFNWTWVIVLLTIIPWARMGSESIAHEAEGRMGYWLRGHEGERNNCFSKIQLVGQKNIETKHLSLVKARF